MTPTRRVSLADAPGLFAALRDPSPRLRTRVLQAIAANPPAALALGRHHGWDVLDELVHQACQGCSIPYYRELVKALAAFSDPRVRALFQKIAEQARDPEILRVVREWPAAGESSPAAVDSGDDGAGQRPSPA